MFQVEVIGSGEFDPAEWLRREVLWASLVAPPQLQMDGWLNEAASQQHNGNVSRRDLFALQAEGADPEMLGLAFFNTGKNVAGMISSSVTFRLFRTGFDESTGRVAVPPGDEDLAVQAEAVAKALQPPASDKEMTDTDVYEECASLMRQITASNEPFSRTHRLLRAGKLMLMLARSEARAWLEPVTHDEDEAELKLTINNGGYPRSVGPTIEALQVVFKQIVSSESYQRLRI